MVSPAFQFLAHALMLLGVATAKADQLPTDPVSTDLVIGELARPSESGRWTLEGENARYSIGCYDQHCHGQIIDAEIVTAAGNRCNGSMLSERAGFAYSGDSGAELSSPRTIPLAGFQLNVVTVQLGCRNWTGSPVFACTAVAGDLYMFTADPGGCATPPQFDEPVLEFLNGLTLARQ